MTMVREGYHVEDCMAVVVCILACLQLTSGRTMLRTLTGHQHQQQQSDTFTSSLPFTHQTHSLSKLQELQEAGQLENNQVIAQSNSSEAADKGDELVVDIADEGPLSDIQMQILQVFLRRYLETGQESAETLISNLVNQIEKRSLHGERRGGKHKAGRRYRSSDQQGASRGSQGNCSFPIDIRVTYYGQCRTFGRAPFAIGACDFEGNSTHPEAYMMLGNFDTC